MRIKELRTRYGLSQSEFAKCLGFTQTAVSNWENEIREPSTKVLHDMADYFGISVDYLVGKEDCMMFNDDMMVNQIVDATNKLDEEDKKKVLDFANYLAFVKKAKQKEPRF